MSESEWRPTKAELRLLERAFACEISGRTFQPRPSKVLTRLAEVGAVERFDRVLRGTWPRRIEGYELTHRGRIAYCESCRGRPTPAAASGTPTGER